MWNSIIVDWASLIFRWLHVVAAIGWIGSSFYFIHLDLSLESRNDLPEGVGGEAWQVHGGGFYRIMKFLVAPKAMPDRLTWFKWEAYATWLSGSCSWWSSTTSMPISFSSTNPFSISPPPRRPSSAWSASCSHGCFTKGACRLTHCRT